MFELKILESDESEDTPKAAHQRMLSWCLRIVVYLVIWLTLSNFGAQAAPKPAQAKRQTVARVAPFHLYCDPAGRCGVHTGIDNDLQR